MGGILVKKIYNNMLLKWFLPRGMYVIDEYQLSVSLLDYKIVIMRIKLKY